MPIASIRRRIGRLEIDPLFVVLVNYPPLTSEEIHAIGLRAERGEEMSKEEVKRLLSQSPVVDGELLIVANCGRVTVKRYIGLDLAEI